MRNRKIQRMVRRGEITHDEGVKMAAANAAQNSMPRPRTTEKPWLNSEGYHDPTAYAAMRNIEREERARAYGAARSMEHGAAR